MKCSSCRRRSTAKTCPDCLETRRGLMRARAAAGLGRPPREPAAFRAVIEGRIAAMTERAGRGLPLFDR